MDNTFAFYSTNPSSPSFYYIVILSYIVISGLISSINYYFKMKSKESSPDSFSVNRSLQLNREQKILKFKFLAAYVLTRASTWAKGPYLFTLYHKYHCFTIDEIGILYIVDAIFAFLSGPIFGSYADRYGRRLFSSFYCLFVVSNLALRITGIRSLAYIAQILTGLGSTLLSTPFESWIVYEASKLIQETPNDRERYLQGIFKDQALFDALCSIIVSAITAIIYTVYGIIAPLLFAILMATIAYFVIILTWDENKPNSINEKSNYDSFLDACCELKKRNVLSIGIIESLWMATLNLYIFIWTPVLENSTDDGKMNIGFIFLVFVLMAINGILLFELIVIHLKCRYYIAYFISLLFELISFLFVYRVDSFIVRLIMFSFINAANGFFPPLNSIYKSKILIEKYRATLMNIFKIPVSIYFIAVLLFLKQISPLIVILICFLMISLCAIIILSLIVFPVQGDLESIKKKQIGNENQIIIETSDKEDNASSRKSS